MNFGSLFSGIGGMDLGLEWAGMTCVWQNDIDDYCLQELNRLWPDVPKHGDVRDVGRHNLEPVDLIAGGFPCTPHSVAGKRRGAEDDRNLWPEFSRVIAELRPRYVLAENVPGIITTYLDTVLSDLEGQGYTCATFNIPACAFDAPHRRERIFIVAYAQLEHDDNGGSGASTIFGKGSEPSELSRSIQNVADANGIWELQPQRSKRKKRRRIGDESGDSSDTEEPGLQNGRPTRSDAGESEEDWGLAQPGFKRCDSSWWSVEPRLGDLVDGLSPELAGRFIRVAKGCPDRVNKLRALGNAVIPAVAQWIGKRILEHDETMRSMEREAVG